MLDHEVATAFRANRRWGKRDRHFIADSVWEVVRWRRALAHVAGSDELEKLLALVWRRNGYTIPEWWPRPEADADGREATLEAQPDAVRQSVPDWLDARGRDELGEDWPPILEALNRRAPVFLRVNRLKSDRDTILSWLESEQVPASPVGEMPDTIRLEGMLPKRLSHDPRIEIQDGGSQMIAPFLQVEPGMKVIDACAGAGGKTLHLAALMQGRGEIVALDVSQRRLDELWKRSKRAGLRNLTIERWDDRSLAKWRGWADRVLIDAPCSGLGTLRRQPDLKWSLSEARLGKAVRTQRRLLDHYPEMLRDGGKFVYATCSVLPSENRGQVEALQERDPRWELEDDHAVDPVSTDFDGFYMARISMA